MWLFKSPAWRMSLVRFIYSSFCSSSSTDLVNSGDESVSESTWKANLNVCSCIRLIGIAAQIFNISNLIQDLPSPQLPPIAFQQPNSSISNVRVGPHLTTECLHQYRWGQIMATGVASMPNAGLHLKWAKSEQRGTIFQKSKIANSVLQNSSSIFTCLSVCMYVCVCSSVTFLFLFLQTLSSRNLSHRINSNLEFA